MGLFGGSSKTKTEVKPWIGVRDELGSLFNKTGKAFDEALENPYETDQLYAGL